MNSFAMAEVLQGTATTNSSSNKQGQIQCSGFWLTTATTTTNSSSNKLGNWGYWCRYAHLQTTTEPYWIQHLEFRQQDKELLTGGNWLTRGIWLTDKHINVFNKLLKQQCLMQNGLQDPLVIAKMAWHSETTGFVQIINLDNLHWVCAANISCPDNTVNIYDSLPAYIFSRLKISAKTNCSHTMHSKGVLWTLVH